MRNPRGVAPLTLALILVGCATAPGYRPAAVPLPAEFREAADTAIAAAQPADSLSAARATDTASSAVPAVVAMDSAPAPVFWHALGDSTLERLIGELRRENLDVRSAEARVRGARSARTETALDFAPTVTAAGSYTRQRISSAAFPIGAGRFPDQDIWDAGFDASWELDLFGRIRRTVQAQSAFVGAADASLRDVRVALTAELARTYFELRGAQERLGVARRNAENQRRSLDVTQQRLDAGRGTAFDTERARTQLAFTLASIPDLEARVASAKYAIGVLVGRPPAAVAAELDSVATVPQLPGTPIVGRPDSLVRRRPDVAAAERQVAARRALVGAARAEYLPRLGVGGSAGYSATALGGLGDDGTFRYAVGPVLSWPALNLGRVKARVDQSRALADEADAQYTQTVLRALQEVETGLARYRSAQARVTRIGEAAAASARAADLARLRFEGGIADFLQVLDAERTQLDAEDQLAQAHIDAATAYASLYKAVGGEGDEPAPR